MRYETLIAWAEQLERPEIVPLLQETLDEEYATEDELTTITKSSVNPRAEPGR